MSNIDKQENQIPNNPSVDDLSVTERFFEKMEFMAVNSAMQNLPKFSETQIDNLIEGFQENDKRVYDYHASKLEKEHELKKKSHNMVIYILLVISVITLSILFFKDVYLDKWLSFIIGLIGGTGINKWFSNTKPDKT